MEPPHRYIRDASASVVHHGDYLNGRDDHALCGMAFDDPSYLGQSEPPGEVCPDCAAKLVEYHLAWWRERALAATAELDALRVKYQQLADERSGRLAAAQPPEQVGEDSSAPDRRAALADVTAEPADAEPISLLDQARRELRALCREFDATVPYRRVKNAMQAFSDELNPDDRVLLAQQIGADGNLIRWSTKEIEALGWHVTGNPVQAEPEEMWDAWTRESYQTPKQSKWRLGRSR